MVPLTLQFIIALNMAKLVASTMQNLLHQLCNNCCINFAIIVALTMQWNVIIYLNQNSTEAYPRILNMTFGWKGHDRVHFWLSSVLWVNRCDDFQPIFLKFSSPPTTRRPCFGRSVAIEPVWNVGQCGQRRNDQSTWKWIGLVETQAQSTIKTCEII